MPGSSRIIHATNLEGMAELRREGVRFAFAYCDPPFFTQREHKTADGEAAFDDRWPSFDDYMATVVAAASDAYSLLIPEGSIVVHLGTMASHYAKVALDREFGRDHFASEIIWKYRRWPVGMTNFQRMHDVLLRYVRDPAVTPRWNQLYEPLSQKTRETHGQRKQRAVWGEGSGKAVRVRTELLEEESPGAPIGDVWEIGIVGPSSHERNGYPTQKPENLIERLLAACTKPGDHVLDPFMGSGTTLVVAEAMGRHAVGIDKSDVAVRYARERLRSVQRDLFTSATGVL